MTHKRHRERERERERDEADRKKAVNEEVGNGCLVFLSPFI